MSGVSPGQRGLRSKTSELNLFRDRSSNTSRLQRQDHHLVPPVPSLATPDSNKPKRKLGLWGKRRKSGSVSPSPSARPSGDSTHLIRKSGETSASPYRTAQSLLTSAGSGRDPTPTRLPSKLPPLDVSPPSLDFSTLSPFSSRNQPNLVGKHLAAGGISSRDRGSPVKTHSNRPLITVTIPPSNAFNEADEDVFVSPRSAPAPPQLMGPQEGGSPASFFSHSVPGSPLRFPFPPSLEDITASSSFPDDTLLRGRSPEFNANFSFPRKGDGTIRNAGRNPSLDLSPMRPLERKMNLRKAHSTVSKSHISLPNGPGLKLLPESQGAKAPQPPSIPLPAPPSVFPINPDDHVADKLPITASTSSLIPVQTRARSKTVSSSSSSPQRDEPRADERVHLQQLTRKRGERRNPLTTDQRDQTLLRVEVSGQRVRLDELAARFQEFTEQNERERKQLVARLTDLEGLVEEQRRVIKDLQSLGPLRDPGGLSWERGIAAIMMRTPDMGSSMFSPVVAFEDGSCPLKRSHTLPDGRWENRRGALGEVGGPPNDQNWSRFIDGTGLTAMNRRGGELPDSPVVREGSEATLVASPSQSDSTSRIQNEAGRSEAGGDATTLLGTGEGVERMEQWTPNMEEILAKLRTFGSGSPIGR